MCVCVWCMCVTIGGCSGKVSRGRMKLGKETSGKKKTISKMEVGEIWARIHVLSDREP